MRIQATVERGPRGVRRLPAVVPVVAGLALVVGTAGSGAVVAGTVGLGLAIAVDELEGGVTPARLSNRFEIRRIDSRRAW
jgi:hypothetical protein